MTAIRETRQWVYELPPDTLFWSKDAPGEPALRNQVLYRLSKGYEPMLEHISRGLYWKRVVPKPSGIIESSPTKQWLRALCWAAGDGGGLAGWIALNKFGWTTQSPCIRQVATLKPKPPKISIMNIEWEFSAANRHRRGLTWGEVSLLEAVRWWEPNDDYPWEYVLWSVYSHEAWFRLPRTLTLRADAFEAAIPFEQPTAFEGRLESMGWPRDPDDPPFAVRLREMAGALRAAGF